ncbi:MAG TPA: DUF87 domain-containing protein, partial [Polyangiales bacterium]|nr:DUF87 domain-containing protein [Polyangiales bacterium]
RLKDEEMTDDALSDLVFKLADRVLEQPRFADLDLDLTRALLFLQSGDARYYTRVVKYLRGQALGRKDAELLGGVAARADGAFGILSAIAKVIGRVDGGALVLLLDQLEDVANHDTNKSQAARLMDLVRHISDNVPNAVVVITCLRDFYLDARMHLTKSVIDRLERDSKPLELKEQRSEEDTREMVGLRMENLFNELEVRYRHDQPCFPIPQEIIDDQRGLRARDLIGHLHRYQQACVASGRLLSYTEYSREEPTAKPTPPGPTPKFAREWAQCLLEIDKVEVPSEDDALLDVLGWTLKVKPEGESVRAGSLLLRMTNLTPRGGKLAKQLEALRKEAKKDRRHAVAVRCSEFGGTPGTALAKELGRLAQEGGRPWVVDQATWRQLVAFKEFSEQHGAEPGFSAWVKEYQPWLQLEDLRKSIGLKPSVPAPKPSLRAPEPGPSHSEPSPRPSDHKLSLGTVVSVRKQTAEIELQGLKQHAAFLGASGSGKTSLALHVIEQAAERGIGVVMLDRKGDLAIYADPRSWDRSDPDPQRVQRLQALRSRLDMRMYTPGNPLGRSLRIRAVPPGLARLPAHERAQLAGYAAQALLSMAGPKTDSTQLAILAKAIEVIAQLSADEPSLPDVISLMHDQDESLLAEIGHLDPKHMKKLVDKLEALRINHSVLLAGDDPPLTAEGLLGLDGSVPAGKVPMTIISTKFLGGPACADFWVSQLLIELSRWCSRSPSSQLQTLLLLDEADAYLPASTKPATKEPLQGLLKRARSAGLGVMLATQSPGDLDYKARDNIGTWWVGRIASGAAIDKMKPLLSECRIDISGALATQSTGEFFQISGGNSVRIRSERSLMNTTQLTEDRIVELARATAPVAHAAQAGRSAK